MKVSIEHSRFIKNILTSPRTHQKTSNIKDKVEGFANRGCFFALTLQNGFTIRSNSEVVVTSNSVTGESTVSGKVIIDVPSCTKTYGLLAEVVLKVNKTSKSATVYLRFPKLVETLTKTGRLSRTELSPFDALYIVGAENPFLVKHVDTGDMEMNRAKFGFMKLYQPVSSSLIQSLQNMQVSS
jgi:hypothetical protein